METEDVPNYKGEMIAWDRPMLARLMDAYGTAEANGDESFIFDGREFLTRYAHYLIQYLQMKLK